MYPLVSSNMAGVLPIIDHGEIWNKHGKIGKWRFLVGRIIYKWRIETNKIRM
jgi:hypothetical protein